MGWDYALVHLKFTVPLATVLTLVSRPLLTRLDAVRIGFLIAIAVTATIPWDSYLIRTGVWTYPDGGVLGYSAWDIPAEELFFFVIQTYITGLLYVICNKPVLLAQYLTTPDTRPKWVTAAKRLGQVVLVVLTLLGGYWISRQDEWTYLGLIFAWACPFLLITWSLTGDMLVQMPLSATVFPIAAPTLFLWFVDELSLRNGVWTIEGGTKLGSSLFGSLDIEEAVFFLITNTLVVVGIAAFDKGAAVCDTHPELYPAPASSLPVLSLIKARVLPESRYNVRKIEGIREASQRLQKKSRSFYIASSVFPGRLRIDLTLLYSFCRLADDLIDDGRTVEEGTFWVAKLREYLDLSYGSATADEIHSFTREHFEPCAYSALDLLPTHILSERPLRELLAGFETDMGFKALDKEEKKTPIMRDEADLQLYARRVASTVGELCLDLVFHHTQGFAGDRGKLYGAAREMGVALQYVNIARDVQVDAEMGRVYIPATWLTGEQAAEEGGGKEEGGAGGLTEAQVLANPHGPAIERPRRRLLAVAFDKYAANRAAMDEIPREARGPMTVAVESYMEIGRVLAEGGLRREGRATVPKGRRIAVVWKTLMAA